ncbi:MAG TPA: TonB-dependent receptor plug domain-containing protein [Chthoniobacterales bacterium]|nr:TonB-dependent receptor plug domain-containing protein [Chthoniobacterales bacterium]
MESLPVMAHRLTTAAFASAFSFLLASAVLAQEAVRSALPDLEPPAEGEPYRSPAELKKLSLEQLLATEITSASRRPEPISQAPSAIDVITAETILRSGVTNIPDALRLAAGIEVAQFDGHNWRISSRGFNEGSNKLQVLMDGRSVYTPLFSGVFWDVQRTFLPDLEQIEVIRGPGATLWGANAINGVINIRTKHARDTQGFLLDGGGGNQEGYAGMRYGGRIGRNTYYRAYVMHQRTNGLHLERPAGGNAEDETEFTQGGFRIDSSIGNDDTFTFQGDVYAGVFGQYRAADAEAEGGNFIARWTHEYGIDSSISLQTYYDRTHRRAPPVIEEDRDTFDIELEGRTVLGAHDLVYGANYRVSADEIENLAANLAFIPASETLHLVSAYVHDEWHLVPRKFALIAGSKFEYNSFSGFEIQPTGRFLWTPTATQTLWGAVSRAVRTPTRLDQDIVSPNPELVPDAEPLLIPNRDFESEELIAYELGYRLAATRDLSFDVVGFYHDYDNIRSAEVIGGTPGDPLDPAIFQLRNLNEGETYGTTMSMRSRLTDWWRVDANFSYLQVDFGRGPGSNDPNDGRGEWNDPDYFWTVRSSIDLPWDLQFDTVLRYVDDLPQPATPSYLGLDLRLAWSPNKNIQVAIVGRDLLDPHHPEFRAQPPAPTREVNRSVFGTVRWSF